jgi:fucose 4-O-acetylase-like acetyltransferase
MNPGSTLSGAFWFIKILFLLLLTYAIFDFVIKKISYIKAHPLITHSVLSVIMLVCGFVCYLKGIRLYDFDKVLSFYILFHIGRIIKEKIHFNMSHIKRVLVMVFSTLVICVCRQFGDINLGANEYVDPIFLLITSISGWLLIYEMSYYLSLVKVLNTILKIIGNNTMSVMVFHFLCFKGVTYLQMHIYDLPQSAISAFPVLYNMPLWWLVYTIVGLSIPIATSLLYKKYIIKNNIGDIKV